MPKSALAFYVAEHINQQAQRPQQAKACAAGWPAAKAQGAGAPALVPHHIRLVVVAQVAFANAKGNRAARGAPLGHRPSFSSPATLDDEQRPADPEL